MFKYSPRKNSANQAPAYSELNPATSSASASGKSNGSRFVSANILMENIISKNGNGFTKEKGILNRSKKEKEEVVKIIIAKSKDKTNS